MFERLKRLYVSGKLTAVGLANAVIKVMSGSFVAGGLERKSYPINYFKRIRDGAI